MEELFEELVYKHLKEHYPRTKFYTLADTIAGNRYVWINKISNWQTYIYLTKYRGQDWCAVITVNGFKGRDILTNELSILGFTVFDL